MSNEVMEKVDSILGSVEMPERHTYFQLKNFVIGKECTVQGQLWQVVKEIRARKDSAEALKTQIADLQDNLELVDIRIEQLRLPENNELDIPVANQLLRDRERGVLIRKAQREKESTEKSIGKLEEKVKYLFEEITYFVNAFDTLSKVEAMKPLDDINAQKQYWNEKLTEELNLRLILNRPLDSDFVKTIMSLDDDAPVKKQMVAMIQRLQQQFVEERDRNRSLKGAQLTQISR